MEDGALWESDRQTPFDDEDVDYATSRSSSPASSSSGSTFSSSSSPFCRRSRRKTSSTGNLEAYNDDLSSAPVSRIPRPRKRKGRCRTEAERRATLETDPWSDVTRLTAKSVFCIGCKKDIKLDKRNDYYPGLWLKHRKLCPGIRSARAGVPPPPTLREQKPMIPQINDIQAAWILESMSIKHSKRSSERQEDPEMVDVAMDLLWTFSVCA
ncbi:hypothetical protein K435DRAFT_799908 [Dendrothele bispora CBS 962.96]|uniref:Uncharacterized protein n=1 Tax=Dendrothele bispora (strain CBS 962.96) TaxID=1314807 RepID=A0A4S8LUH1_DENBC|nr:hypothetical protein K435DRAFT_799908 [Dendrothele bispora CBS 962.96]